MTCKGFVNARLLVGSPERAIKRYGKIRNQERTHGSFLNNARIWKIMESRKDVNKADIRPAIKYPEDL